MVTVKTTKPKTDLQPVSGVGRAFCIPLAKFQAEIPLFKCLPKETLLHNARLIPFRIKSTEFKLSADSNTANPMLGTKNRNVFILFYFILFAT